MSPYTPEEMAEQTAVAASIMDELVPGWNTRINTNTLDLQSCSNCICGQNDYEWNRANNVYRDRLGEGSPFSGPEWEPYWLEEIAKRIPAPVPARELVTA